MVDIKRENQLAQAVMAGNRDFCKTDEERATFDRMTSMAEIGVKGWEMTWEMPDDDGDT
jgi:hypothetical protein